jgi:plastocyanin
MRLPKPKPEPEPMPAQSRTAAAAALAAAALAATAVLSAAGCGEESPVGDDLAEVELEVGATVRAADLAFDPPAVTVTAGELVELENADGTNHTFTATDGKFDSRIIEPGERFTFATEEPGGLEYRCEIHAAMRGRIVVEAPPGSG